MSEAERTYALVRLSSGDYVLPSNDGLVLWRIYSYEEDGSASWIVNDSEGREREVPIKGTFWACARWHQDGKPGVPKLDVIDESFLDHDNWRDWATTQRTRREAIEEALKA